MNINACRFLSSSLVLLTFFGGMLALHVEWDVLHNTLGAKKLALYSVGAGALLLLVLSPFERLLCAENESEERWAIRVLVAVGILAGSVGVVSHTNQRYGEAAGRIEYLPILDKEYISRLKVPEKWTLLVKVLGREMWILVSEADWKSVSSGDSYLAVIKNGYWGFHVIGCPNKCGQDAAQQCVQADSPASGGYAGIAMNRYDAYAHRLHHPLHPARTRSRPRWDALKSYNRTAQILARTAAPGSPC